MGGGVPNCSFSLNRNDLKSSVHVTDSRITKPEESGPFE